MSRKQSAATAMRKAKAFCIGYGWTLERVYHDGEAWWVEARNKDSDFVTWCLGG